MAELGFKPSLTNSSPSSKSFQDVVNSSSSLRGIRTFGVSCLCLWPESRCSEVEERMRASNYKVHTKHTDVLLKMQVLTQEIWAGPGSLHFAISTPPQVVPVLPVHRPHLEQHLSGRQGLWNQEDARCPWPQHPCLNRRGWAGSCLAPASSANARSLQEAVPGTVRWGSTMVQLLFAA